MGAGAGGYRRGWTGRRNKTLSLGERGEDSTLGQDVDPCGVGSFSGPRRILRIYRSWDTCLAIWRPLISWLLTFLEPGHPTDVRHKSAGCFIVNKCLSAASTS